MIYELKDKLNALLPATCEDIAEILDSKVNFQVIVDGSCDELIMVDLTVEVQGKKSYMGSCSMNLLPGNHDIMVINSSYIMAQHRGLGIGSLLHSVRLKALKEAGAQSALCTVADDNAAELAIVKKNGWTKVFSVSQTASLYAIQFF